MNIFSIFRKKPVPEPEPEPPKDECAQYENLHDKLSTLLKAYLDSAHHYDAALAHARDFRKNNQLPLSVDASVYREFCDMKRANKKKQDKIEGMVFSAELAAAHCLDLLCDAIPEYKRWIIVDGVAMCKTTVYNEDEVRIGLTGYDVVLTNERVLDRCERCIVFYTDAPLPDPRLSASEMDCAYSEKENPKRWYARIQ